VLYLVTPLPLPPITSLRRVNVVMMTLIYSNVDSDDENNDENDGNDDDIVRTRAHYRVTVER
jgi:hypothetical protein